MKHSAFAALALFAVFTVAGCAKNNDAASDGTGSEVAITSVGGGSAASEGTVAFNQTSQKRSWFAQVGNFLAPVSSAWAVPSCNWASLVSACTNNSETLSFSSCSSPMDSAISIQGSETLAWTGASCCTATPLAASSTTPCSFTRRTVNGSGAADPMTRSVGRNSVTLNTEDTSGFEQPKTGGFTVTCQGTGGVDTCEAQRQVAISGAHYVGDAGRARWDHTVSTDIPVVVQGHDATRKVLSGTIRVQHNLAQYTSVSTITTPLTYTAGCCHPTGGAVSTTFSGGKFDGKTETMTFGPACAEASLSDTDQQRTGLTLHHCL